MRVIQLFLKRYLWNFAQMYCIMLITYPRNISCLSTVDREIFGSVYMVALWPYHKPLFLFRTFSNGYCSMKKKRTCFVFMSL